MLGINFTLITSRASQYCRFFSYGLDMMLALFAILPKPSVRMKVDFSNVREKARIKII
jgi:hypothetical protein